VNLAALATRLGPQPTWLSPFVLEDGDAGFSFGAPEHKLGIKGSPTRELYFDECIVMARQLLR
jgi:alkylation response protein AidB-like acyl-CoA dehydrogenase